MIQVKFLLNILKNFRNLGYMSQNSRFWESLDFDGISSISTNSSTPQILFFEKKMGVPPP